VDHYRPALLEVLTCMQIRPRVVHMWHQLLSSARHSANNQARYIRKRAASHEGERRILTHAYTIHLKHVFANNSSPERPAITSASIIAVFNMQSDCLAIHLGPVYKHGKHLGTASCPSSESILQGLGTEHVSLDVRCCRRSCRRRTWRSRDCLISSRRITGW
jgi:hypothetical protein